MREKSLWRSWELNYYSYTGYLYSLYHSWCCQSSAMLDKGCRRTITATGQIVTTRLKRTVRETRVMSCTWVVEAATGDSGNSGECKYTWNKVPTAETDGGRSGCPGENSLNQCSGFLFDTSFSPWCFDDRVQTIGHQCRTQKRPETLRPVASMSCNNRP